MVLALTIAAQSVQSNGATIQATPTGGTGPVYTYAWYRSTTNGFSPGGGNVIAGAVAATLVDTGLIPNTIYYYKCIVTDTGHSNDTATSSQLTVTTSGQSQSQNSFTQAPLRGDVDQTYNTNTISCLVDPELATLLYPGSPVKLVPTAIGGLPVVTAVTAETDEVFGFINYDIKNGFYAKSMACQVSIKNNVQYQYATIAISAGQQLQLDLANNGIKVAADTGDTIVGWAFDSASGPGVLFRMYVETPSFRDA